MGTRGAFGVRIDGKDKITYNHFDSYPDGLGKDLAEQLADMIKRHKLEGLRVLAREVVVIDEEAPDALDVVRKRLGDRFRDPKVSTGEDVYAYMRALQGDLRKILEDARIMADGHAFVADSLFCEWAYVANLDDGILEVYQGFQKTHHRKGRYASDTAPRGYFPVALIESMPIDQKLPKAMAELIKEIDEGEE